MSNDCKSSHYGEETVCQTLVCGHCGKSFVKKHLLARHIREVHRNNLDLLCKECGKQCCSSGAMYHHMKTHLPPAYECADCGRKYERKKTLALHWHREHGDGIKVQSSSSSAQVLLKCRVCDKTFKSASGLSRHRASIHLQKFPHICYICGQAFTQKISLLRHQKVHDNTRPFQCQYCIGSFKDKWHLKQHERTHTGAKPYVCSICEEAYRFKVQLREHVSAVHESLERKCPDCTYTCVTFGALALHWKMKHASEWVHRKPTKGHNSMYSNEEISSLSIEWRNKHALAWADPKTREKRERINIALLKDLAAASLSSEYDSGELALWNNSTSQRESFYKGIPGYHYLYLKGLTNISDEEVTEECVPSIDTAKENVMEAQETAHVSTGHCETTVKGVLMANKRMVLQPVDLDSISGISEVPGGLGREKRKSGTPAMNMKMKKKKKQKEREQSTNLEKSKVMLDSSIST